jgi:hypothetical protein
MTLAELHEEISIELEMMGSIVGAAVFRSSSSVLQDRSIYFSYEFLPLHFETSRYVLPGSHEIPLWVTI